MANREGYFRRVSRVFKSKGIMSDISKPTTTMSKENMNNFKEGWDRIFGKKRKIKKKKIKN